jgi:hypothetical protein
MDGILVGRVVITWISRIIRPVSFSSHDKACIVLHRISWNGIQQKTISLKILINFTFHVLVQRHVFMQQTFDISFIARWDSEIHCTRIRHTAALVKKVILCSPLCVQKVFEAHLVDWLIRSVVLSSTWNRQCSCRRYSNVPGQNRNQTRQIG